MGIKRKILILICLLAGWRGTEAATVVVSGTNQVEDTFLRGDNTQTTAPYNYGSTAYMIVGNLNGSVIANGLMRFTDFPSVSGQMVTNATLRLYNQNNANQTGDVTVNIYEVTATNGDWVAGTANNAVQTGSSGWRYKVQNTGNWAGGQNGAGVAGTDYVTNLVGSAPVIDGSAGYIDIALDAAVVRKWIDHPDQNFGIVLIAPGALPGQVVYFNSSEAASNVPELALETGAKATLRLYVITGSEP